MVPPTALSPEAALGSTATAESPVQVDPVDAGQVDPVVEQATNSRRADVHDENNSNPDPERVQETGKNLYSITILLISTFISLKDKY